MWFTFALFVNVRENEGAAEFPLAIEQGRRLPAGPRLQAKPANEIYDFRRRENALLDGYSWVDKSAGTVRIPIAEAMRLTVERGLPARRRTAAGTAVGRRARRSCRPTRARAGRWKEEGNRTQGQRFNRSTARAVSALVRSAFCMSGCITRARPAATRHARLDGLHQTASSRRTCRRSSRT